MKHIKKTLEIITLHKIWSAFFTWPSAPNIITLTKFTSLSLKMNNVSVRTYSFLRKKCLNLILLPTQPPNTYYKQSRIHKKLYCRCLMRFWIYLWQVNNNYTGLVCLFCAKYSGMDQLKFVVDSMTKFETTWSVKTDHITSNFEKSVFHKFLLVHFWLFSSFSELSLYSPVAHWGKTWETDWTFTDDVKFRSC